MPRKASGRHEAQRRRQRRYRARLAAVGRPEASAVDVAVAAAVAGLVAEAALEVQDGACTPTTAPEIVGRVVRESLSRLTAAGYKRDQAAKALHRRLRRFEFSAPPVTR